MGGESKMNSVTVHALLMVLIMGAVTHLIRAFPFIVFSLTGKPPKIVIYLGQALSPAAIAMLVVYCFRNVELSVSGIIPEITASAAVVLLHLWKKNPLVSITAGTLIYMFLLRMF